jgi:4-alpha-glucanotransferase
MVLETMMEMMTERENTLKGLAQACGIQLEWRDIWQNVHPVDDDVCRALLSAMEIKADTQADIDQAFDQLQHQTVARWLESVMVISEQEPALEVAVNLPKSLTAKSFHWQLLAEDGERREGQLAAADMTHVDSVELATHHEKIERYRFRVDGVPPQGYHRLILRENESGQEVDMLLVVTPSRCFMPSILENTLSEENDAKQLKAAKVWGPAVQLYAVNSRRNWGMGDFTDLRNIVDWCADQGAAMVGLNPLHALFPHNPSHCSPYSPSSRIFFNVLYLDVEAVPDFSESEEARQLVLNPTFQEALAKLREEVLVNYADAGRRKLEAMELLYQNFCRRHLSENTERAQEFKEYVNEHGPLLERFALFHALQERFHREDPSVWGWPVWPEAYRDPESPAVREFAEANRERIGFYQYLQWQVEVQLQAIGERCWQKNLGIGLYMDMAVGVDRGGADVWSNQHLFAKSSAVGAPPDEYNQKGQDWGLPPLIPEKMREDQYQSFIQILRQNMKFSGALRIDHVMGLFRLFWIPPNMPPSQGAYVHYPVDELFGILALESQRNHCMVIGEDMGTVPEAIRSRMQQWGVYSYKVFYFEKGEDSYKSPEEYQDTAAVAISTHDLPTLAGFWEGRDIAVRTELDLYPSKELRDRQIKDRVMERVAILHLLEKFNLLPEGVTTDPASIPEVTPAFAEAVHKLVAQTESKVFMVQFEDMLLQREQINLPGTTEPTYPNWRRRLTLPLEDLLADPRAQAIGKALREVRPRFFVQGNLSPKPSKSRKPTARA